MDPITVLLSALSLAGTAAKPVSDQVIKDGYAGLKALIVRSLGQLPQSGIDTHGLCRGPGHLRKARAKVLREAGVDRDQDVLDGTTELLKRAENARLGISGSLVGQLNAQGGRALRPEPQPRFMANIASV